MHALAKFPPTVGWVHPVTQQLNPFFRLPVVGGGERQGGSART